MASAILRRAILYVPGSARRFLDKSKGLTVDTVAYDLEDSVTPERKPEARLAVRDFLFEPRAKGIKEQAVRINAVESGYALADLTEVTQKLKAPNVDAIVIPKVNSAADIRFVTEVIRHQLPERHPTSSEPGKQSSASQPPLRLLALVESAKAVMNLDGICKASPFLSGLVFAAEDFCLDLDITRTQSLTELLYARSAIATAARAHELATTCDLVCTTFRGEEGQRRLEEECIGGKFLGYNAKQCIHPAQVETVMRIFSPEQKEVDWAMRVVIADAKANKQGRGAWTLDGKMIDIPVVGKAKGIVNKAELCGAEIDALREKWKDQEPE